MSREDAAESDSGISRPQVDVDQLDHEATETHSDTIEGEVTRDYWECPNPDCDASICTWMDCPECFWYDGDVWERTLEDDERIATDGDVEDADKFDLYQALFQGMKPGLLITVNESGGASGPGYGEMRVEYVTSTGVVNLVGPNNEWFKLFHDTARGPVLKEIDVTGRPSHETVVETIEVIGQ